MTVRNTTSPTPRAAILNRQVVGFLFCGDYVLLQNKKRGPTHVSGRYNGPGGTCRERERFCDAMRREFREETGVDADDWLRVGRFAVPGAIVEVFAAWSGELVTPPAPGDESLVWYKWQSAMYQAAQLDPNFVADLAWLLPCAARARELHAASARYELGVR